LWAVSQFPPETNYVDVGGAQVGYQVVGEGPVDLVVAWGLGSNIDLNWDVPPTAAFLMRLASFSRLICFDRRGTGVSDPIGRDTAATWEDWTEDVRAVLGAAGSARAAFFAVADATPIAMVFAAMQPDLVSALVLVSAMARYLEDDDYPIGASPALLDAIVRLMEQTWGTPELARSFTPSLGDDTESVRILAKLMRVSATPRSTARQFDYLARQLDVRQALPLIQAPTLVIHTNQNTSVPIALGRHVAEHIAGARFVELPGGDAAPWGPELIDEVAEFLTGERPVVPIDRILTTVVFTDIVGSTAQAASLGDQRWHSILDAHDHAVREQLRRFRGNEINTTGDGFVASFDGPARAIRCAQAIAEATRNLGVEVRVGLHTGECEVRGDDLGGLAVHIAARVVAAAEPDEVLVSSTVKDLVAGSGITFKDRGEHDLKGVPETWRLYAAHG
jgi:class 3 adenylate cyclase